MCTDTFIDLYCVVASNRLTTSEPHAVAGSQSSSPEEASCVVSAAADSRRRCCFIIFAKRIRGPACRKKQQMQQSGGGFLEIAGLIHTAPWCTPSSSTCWGAILKGDSGASCDSVASAPENHFKSKFALRASSRSI